MSEIRSMKQRCPLCESDLWQFLFKINYSEDKVVKCLNCGVLYRFFKEKAKFLDYFSKLLNIYVFKDQYLCSEIGLKQITNEIKKK